MLKKLLYYVCKKLFEPDYEKKKADEQRLVEFYRGKHKKQPFIKNHTPTHAN